MQVVGHRGAKALQPENTVEGFQYALNLGCEAVECDVHLTRDGRLVVIHDATVDRTTNGSGHVGDFTFAEIRQLDAGQGRCIPTLEEVLAVVGGRALLLCELKGAFTPEPTVRIIQASGFADRVIFTSFSLGRIAQVKCLDSSLRTGALFKDTPADAVEQAAALGCSLVNIKDDDMTVDFLTRAHARGLLLRVYNPDTPEDIQRAIDFAPDFIGSNRPDLALKLLGRLKQDGE